MPDAEMHSLPELTVRLLIQPLPHTLLSLSPALVCLLLNRVTMLTNACKREKKKKNEKPIRLISFFLLFFFLFSGFLQSPFFFSSMHSCV